MFTIFFDLLLYLLYVVIFFIYLFLLWCCYYYYHCHYLRFIYSYYFHYHWIHYCYSFHQAIFEECSLYYYYYFYWYNIYQYKPILSEHKPSVFMNIFCTERSSHQVVFEECSSTNTDASSRIPHLQTRWGNDEVRLRIVNITINYNILMNRCV